MVIGWPRPSSVRVEFAWSAFAGVWFAARRFFRAVFFDISFSSLAPVTSAPSTFTKTIATTATYRKSMTANAEAEP